MRIRESIAAGWHIRKQRGWAATTTAIIAGITAAVGTAVSATAAYSQGQATKAAQKFNSQVANNNALAAQQQAQADAEQIQIKNRRVTGMQRAALAAAGVVGGSGTDVEYDSAVSGELDRLSTLYKGHVQSNADQSQAELDKRQGNSAALGGMFAAGGTLLTGAGTSLYQAYRIRNNPTIE